MAQIKNTLDILNIKTIQDLTRFLSNAFRDIQQAVNGNITFSENFRGTFVSVNFTAANTNTFLTHGLGYTPSGYIVTTASAAMSVYDGNQTAAPFDSTQVFFLRSSAIGTVTIFLF